MSIWCSGAVIGHDDWDDPNEPQRGDVRSYATGWSNHFPTQDVERPASIEIASIPAWCVPGHREDFSYEFVGPWLRLDVDGWEHNYYRPEEVLGPKHLSVVCDVEAVQALVHDLTEWLAQPKAMPLPEAPADTSSSAGAGDREASGVSLSSPSTPAEEPLCTPVSPSAERPQP